MVCKAEGEGIWRLQPSLGGTGLLQGPLPGLFGLVPQQPPQQLPARILRNGVDERDPTNQVLVRSLRIRNVLGK